MPAYRVHAYKNQHVNAYLAIIWINILETHSFLWFMSLIASFLSLKSRKASPLLYAAIVARKHI